MLKKLLLIFCLVFIALGSLSYFSLSPVNKKSPDEIRVVVSKGSSISKIAQELKNKNLIKNIYIFKIFVKLKNLDNKIQAGSFLLGQQMSLPQIVQELIQGSEDIWVTIPEGWRREEIAQSMIRQDFTDFDQAEFLELSQDSEGMLFPDTYLLPQEITAEAFYNLLINNFEQKTQSLNLTAADLILASLIEREGKGEKDMKIIAGILKNRLEINQALEIDATLQYITGFNEAENSWWSNNVLMAKESNSQFNTYKNPGLPPAPICNPGLAAIKAALNPDQNNYLYYLHDKTGQAHYSSNYEQHLVNINQYLR